MTMIPGSAVLNYLRESANSVYPKLSDLGERLRNGMAAAFERSGLLGRTIGIGSLCGAYLPLDPATQVRNAGDMQKSTDIKRIDHEFRIRMLNEGVYMVHGGGAISTAHTEEEVDQVTRITEVVARQMC